MSAGTDLSGTSFNVHIENAVKVKGGVKEHTVWPMSWLKLVYAGSLKAQAFAVADVRGGLLIYHGVLIECSRMVWIVKMKLHSVLQLL